MLVQYVEIFFVNFTTRFRLASGSTTMPPSRSGAQTTDSRAKTTRGASTIPPNQFSIETILSKQNKLLNKLFFLLLLQYVSRKLLSMVIYFTTYESDL